MEEVAPVAKPVVRRPHRWSPGSVLVTLRATDHCTSARWLPFTVLPAFSHVTVVPDGWGLDGSDPVYEVEWQGDTWLMSEHALRAPGGPTTQADLGPRTPPGS
jgi:hypothetical protein